MALPTEQRNNVLCLGPKGAGKTHLLSSLQHPDSINNTSHSVPTIGTNIFSIQLPQQQRKKNASGEFAMNGKRGSTAGGSNGAQANGGKATAMVREIGGTMAPMWCNYLADVSKIMYVVDTSNLCQISAAGKCLSIKTRKNNSYKISLGVLFYGLLAEPRLQGASILIVLSKMDLAYRQMRNEALLMLQLEKLRKQIRQQVAVVEASAVSSLGHAEIVQWLAK